MWGLGWLGYGQTTKDKQDATQVTEAVIETGATLQELEVKQTQLKRRAERVQEEATAAQEQGDEVTLEARVRDWNALQDDIEHYGILIENTRATRSTLDSVAANASVFQTQKQAVAALETVNAQTSVGEVDRTHEKLERHMDTSQQFSRVMGARLRKNPVRRPQNGGRDVDPAVRETVEKWRLQKMPKAPVGDAPKIPGDTQGVSRVLPPKGKEEEQLNK